MNENITVLVVFTAGLLSFFSPCILPLIPSYFGILAGTGFADLKQTKTKSVLLPASAGFILGFSAVFIIMGILLNSVFFLLYDVSFYINIFAGLMVILLGLNIIFYFLPFLNYEKRPFLGVFKKQDHDETKKQPGILKKIAAPFLGGAAFAAGWTPCIGPVLTSVLLLAGQSGKTTIAILYLGIYSLGLGLPFFLCALFMNIFLNAFSRIKKYLPLIQRISGILLIIIGIMILTGQYSALNIWIQKLTGV